MSDTPQTDAKAVSVIGFYSCATVPADFARDLERERDEAVTVMHETRRRLDDAWLEIDRLKGGAQ
jgi:zona occludens toxin (predicted ATPase)